MFEIGNKSLVFIAVTLGFLGMVSIFQVAMQLEKVIPDYSMVGAAFIKGMIRELGPTIAGLMVATRTGSGIAAEIGSMVVTEQVDALRMTNADPVSYLIVPRFLACGVCVLVLTVFGVCVAVLSGMLMGKVGFGIAFDTFLNLRLVQWEDVISGGAKALAYGTAIPIIAGHAGLSATGGSEGVGSATTRAVVNSSFAVIVLDLAISSAIHLLR
jgi:phospholipid/cholesterol/gamma-HCH transport system permease protein